MSMMWQARKSSSRAYTEYLNQYHHSAYFNKTSKVFQGFVNRFKYNNSCTSSSIISFRSFDSFQTKLDFLQHFKVNSYSAFFQCNIEVESPQLKYSLLIIAQMEEASKSKEKLAKSKSQDQPQEEKANSVFIAFQLINGDPSQYAKRLLDFKNIKNQNYEKFSERILENLTKNNLNFAKSLQIFQDINLVADDENTTAHQMSCILEGFYRFWIKCKISLEAMEQGFDFINKIYSQLAKKYIYVCKELIVKDLSKNLESFREQALKLVNKYYRGTKAQEDKILPLVHQFNLYDIFGSAKVIEIALRHSNPNDISYIFKSDEKQVRHELVRLYIDKCVAREGKDDLKKCQSIIRILKLDPFEYKNMIQKMIGRYINYQLRTNKLYFIELVIHHDEQLIQALVIQLLKQNRLKQAKYFIVNYGLDSQHYCGQISHKQRQSIRNIRNILVDNDRFGPTEIEVLEQRSPNPNNILYMKNLGLDESNITFVDESNIHEIDFERQFSASIGMDTENTGGVHVFDQSQMTILQIFNGRHVYIFDFLNLARNKYLKRIMEHIFTYCKIYGHDHQKQITSIQKELQLNVQQKVMQELQRSRTLDTSKYFKKIYPKETKSNLVYLTEFLLSSTLSKYEQCSGWRNRPLRKAQLHYASLDCILPFVLGQKLEIIEQKMKK